jgi:ribosome-associated protein YbcJ (S4-like RNA binding protein)
MYRKLLSVLFCVSLLPLYTAGDSLIIGSSNSDTANSTFEKHDDSGNLLLTGNLDIPRSSHAATLFTNGSIFVAGGYNDSTSWEILDTNGVVLSSGLLQDQRVSPGADLLTNGNVFIAGGVNTPSTWEIHDPTGALVSSGILQQNHSGGQAVVALQNGNVWISGSNQVSGDPTGWEIHDSSGNLVSSGILASTRQGSPTVLLSNGNVMIIGGDLDTGTFEIHSPTGGLVSSGTLFNNFNGGADAVVLTDANVFIFGSACCSGFPGSPSTWEIRNANGGFVSTGSLFSPRGGSGGAVLSNGNVFINGGDSAPATWEIRNVNGGFVSQGNLNNTRYPGHSLTHF